jgi:hypothetical protein
MSNVSANIAVAILRVNMYWSINLGRLGDGIDKRIHTHPQVSNRNFSETLDSSQYSTLLTFKSRNLSFKARRENVSLRESVVIT